MQTATHQVSAGQYTITVSDANRPFSNNFTVNEASVVQYNGADEITALVTCTADSNEPGRIYRVNWSLTGELQCCNTVN